MSDEDAELREVIRLLLRASTEYQLRAKELSVVLNWVLKLSPTERAEVSDEEIAKRLLMAREVFAKLIQNRTVELEQALETGNQLLAALQTYVSALSEGE